MRENANKLQECRESQEYSETKNFLLNLSGTSLKQLRTEEDFDMRHIQTRSVTYNKYLSFYVFFFRVKSWMQLIMRALFFIVIILSSVLIVWSCFSCISTALQSQHIELTGIVAIVSSLVGMLTAFIALPEIVAKNLFPQKEDDISADLFNKMFEHDVELRKLHNEARVQIKENHLPLKKIESEQKNNIV